MSGENANLTLLQQREIEARIVGPVVRAFAAELGQEKAVEILGRVISELARQGGAELARRLGDHSLAAFARTLDLWCANGALELDVLEKSPERLSFNVVRCRYAEMYRALGMADLGATLSCRRDFSLAEGFSPEIQLTRTQTLMGGAPFCDFRFRRVDREETEAVGDSAETGAGAPGQQTALSAARSNIPPAEPQRPAT